MKIQKEGSHQVQLLTLQSSRPLANENHPPCCWWKPWAQHYQTRSHRSRKTCGRSCFSARSCRSSCALRLIQTAGNSWEVTGPSASFQPTFSHSWLWTCSACSSTRSRTLALFCLWVPFWSGIDHGSGPALLSYCSYSNITHRGKLTILLISKCEIKKQVEKSNYKYIFIRAINWDKYR